MSDIKTRKITMAQVQEQDTDYGIIKALKEVVIPIPSNVIDVDYFTHAVQFYVLRYATHNVSSELAKITQELKDLKKAGKDDTTNYSKKEDKRNNALTLQKLLNDFIKNFDKELEETYSNVKDVKNVFMSDTFSKMYCWFVTNSNSYNYLKNKDEADKVTVEKIQFHVADESKVITYLSVFDLAENQAEKKQSAKLLETFANEHFATNGGELYKNVSFKFSVEKVNKGLYSRFRKLLSNDGKGHFKDEEHTAFQMSMQLFALCLIQLKVPVVSGNTITVDEIADCRSVLAVKKKEKKEEKAE